MRPAKLAAALLVFLLCGGCARERAAKVSLEVFILTPAAEDRAVQYVKRATDLSQRSIDPDRAARELMQGIATPAILHSTSWRWEKDGTIVLTYLAYCESANFVGLNPVRLTWDDFAPPAPTDPQHPRPAVIRERDVLAHGVRHLSFLVRYARDGQLADALSPRSLTFFQAMPDELAGRIYGR
jgi:hypothetical protein